MLKKLIKWVKDLFCGKQEMKKRYAVVLPGIISGDWDVCSKGLSPWNSHAGLNPMFQDDYMRLECIRDGDSFRTSAVKTKEVFGDGKFECEARFKSGKSTWPAIWMIHPKGGDNNYATYFEIDLSEYYETRDTTETGYHCPQSMRGGGKYVKSVSTPIKKDDWNKFECEWDDKAINVRINGNIVLSISNDGDPNHFPVDESARTFQIILSMQYTNRWLSEPDLSELPLWMDVRNVRLCKLIK